MESFDEKEQSKIEQIKKQYNWIKWGSVISFIFTCVYLPFLNMDGMLMVFVFVVNAIFSYGMVKFLEKEFNKRKIVISMVRNNKSFVINYITNVLEEPKKDFQKVDKEDLTLFKVKSNSFLRSKDKTIYFIDEEIEEFYKN